MRKILYLFTLEYGAIMPILLKIQVFGFESKIGTREPCESRVTPMKYALSILNLMQVKVKVMQIVNQLSLTGKLFNVNTIKKMLDGNECSTRIPVFRIPEFSQLRF